MFFQTLKAETAELHEALEENRFSRRIMADDVTMEDYANFLAKLYGFVSVFEENLMPQVHAKFPEVTVPYKSGLMRHDLEKLGKTIESIPRISKIKLENEYPDVDAVLGGLYVLEGSTLGGMVIYAHLREKLGEIIADKSSYFTVYQKNTGTHWREFLGEFEQVAQRSNQIRIIEGAKKTYNKLAEWMD